MRNLLTVLLVLFTAIVLSAQTEEDSRPFTWDVGVEIQAYPTGIIPAFAAELGIGERNGLNFRIGVNIFDHRDLGMHDTETGRGPGFS
ncbi:MAG: hypothetical protein ACI959_001388, partial [Limisphaerales bacterium]